MRPSREEIERAARVLHEGGLAAFPTETVYGLGADASSPAAIRRLYAVKGRPADHPVIVHVASARDLDAWATDVPDDARALARALWPGPLTLVLRRRPGVLDEVTGGLDTVAVRVCAHPVAAALVEAFGGGVAAPSANRFGRVSPTTAEHVRADLGADVDVVLDGGPCGVGVESTIVDCSGERRSILRHGGVPAGTVERILGRRLDERGSAVRAPGTLAAHYAPHARVELVAQEDAAARAAALAPARVGLLGPEAAPGTAHLAVPADADGYARVLYARLREADALGLDVVLAVPPPPDGVGAAVLDRLRRAAASG